MQPVKHPFQCAHSTHASLTKILPKSDDEDNKSHDESVDESDDEFDDESYIESDDESYVKSDASYKDDSDTSVHSTLSSVPLEKRVNCIVIWYDWMGIMHTGRVIRANGGQVTVKDSVSGENVKRRASEVYLNGRFSSDDSSISSDGSSNFDSDSTVTSEMRAAVI